MNAYELADFIKAGGENIDRSELANMLRQQANDIGSLNARLKQQADRIAELEKQLQGYQTATKHYREKSQIKELSDEEIYKLAGEFWIDGSFDDGELDYVGFAKAILKKASEK